MVERQMRYALPAILKLARGETQRIEVRGDAQEAYNRTLQNRLLTTAWAGGCESWYKTGSGIMPNNWGSDTRTFAKMMRRFDAERSEEHTSELQSLMRISYAVFCLKKKKTNTTDTHISTRTLIH